MRNIISVAVYSFAERKGFMSDYIEAGYGYENRSPKDIRAFEGRVVFKDVLGNELADTELKVLSTIKAGAKATGSHNLPFLAYGGLRDKTLSDIEMEWKPKKILFSDGSASEIGGPD